MMSRNICGNCVSFRPASGDRFYNCTVAGHAGLGYGMQVRVDTQACDHFSAHHSSSQDAGELRVERLQPAEPPGLCTLGQKSLVLAVGFSILLVTWLLYTCATV